MNDEIDAYIEFLLKFDEVCRPQMPKINHSAYSDNEYKSAIDEILDDYKFVDDFEITLKHLKGE